MVSFDEYTEYYNLNINPFRTGVPSFIHINYGLGRLEKASVCTDDICEIRTKSITST